MIFLQYILSHNQSYIILFISIALGIGILFFFFRKQYQIKFTLVLLFLSGGIFMVDTRTNYIQIHQKTLKQGQETQILNSEPKTLGIILSPLSKYSMNLAKYLYNKSYPNSDKNYRTQFRELRTIKN